MPAPLQGCCPYERTGCVAWLLKSDRIACDRYEELAKHHKCRHITRDPSGKPLAQYLCDSCATTKAKLRIFGQPTKPLAR